MKIGRKYGRLTVVRIINRDKSECLCDCGNTVIVWNTNLYKGHTKSCGCYNKEKSKERKTKGPNPIEEHGDVIAILLSNSSQKCLIDRDSYELVKKYRWSLSRRGYVVSRLTDGGYMFLIHRVITQAPDELVVDHINHNPLDNRRSNLRVCCQLDNSHNSKLSKRNTSKYKGVQKVNNKWLTRIYYKGKQHRIGLFDTAEDAALARDKKTKELYGEYGFLNFPDKN